MIPSIKRLFYFTVTRLRFKKWYPATSQPNKLVLKFQQIKKSSFIYCINTVQIGGSIKSRVQTFVSNNPKTVQQVWLQYLFGKNRYLSNNLLQVLGYSN